MHTEPPISPLWHFFAQRYYSIGSFRWSPGRRWWNTVCAGFIGGCLAVHAQEPTVRIGFSDSSVQIPLASALDVTVSMEGPVPFGLFSYGLRLIVHGPAGAPAVQPLAIIPPADLDFNGVLGAGATRVLTSAAAGIKGTVDVLRNPVQYYTGTELATFRLFFPVAANYQLTLEPFNTLGPTESIFVSGNGTVLDRRIQFGTAVVNVVPEPQAWLLGCLGGLMCCGWASLRRPAVIRKDAPI
jgi:hypothetical protein